MRDFTSPLRSSLPFIERHRHLTESFVLMCLVLRAMPKASDHAMDAVTLSWDCACTGSMMDTTMYYLDAKI